MPDAGEIDSAWNEARLALLVAVNKAGETGATHSDAARNFAEAYARLTEARLGAGQLAPARQ